METKGTRIRKAGDPVVFVDEFRVPRSAIATIVWRDMGGGGIDGCNLVYVEGDPKRDDTYGRQIGRAGSVVHKSQQVATGNYWCHEADLDDEQRARLNEDRA